MTTTVSSAGSQQCLVLVEVITDIARLQVCSGGRFETWVIPEDRKFRTCTRVLAHYQSFRKCRF